MAHMNEAYNLDLFQPREPRLVAVADSKKVTETKRKHAHRQDVLNKVVYFCVAVLVLGLAAYFITCNVRLTEMNKVIMDAETELGTLQSEQVRLEAELAGLTSAEQINKYAQEHGLLPMDSNQIYYIAATDEDQVSLAAGEDNWFVKMWSALVGFLS